MRGHVALITGGGRGIGEAIARRFVREGAKVFIASRTRSELERVARETGASFEVCDVAFPVQVQALARKVGPVQILVNNAGIAEGAPFHRTDLTMWDRIMDTNVKSAFLMCRAFVPGMVRRNYGRIVNIASLAGKRGVAYITAYCASKHALVGLNSSLAMEFKDHDITVNAVCPGYVDTEATRNNVGKIARATKRPQPEIMKSLLASLGQTRLLSPNDVAEVALALARPECSHTGAAIDL